MLNNLTGRRTMLKCSLGMSLLFAVGCSPSAVSRGVAAGGAMEFLGGITSKILGAVILLSILSGCSDESEFLGGNIHGYNHTASGVNSFTVNGWGGGRAGPYGKGGAVCCISLPRQWRPGMMAEVRWEADPNALAPTPAGAAEFSAFMDEHEKKYTRHTATVEVPHYEDVCGIEVHFLPCNEVKLSTSCWGYSSPNNPIKEPRRMEEPPVCPVK